MAFAMRKRYAASDFSQANPSLQYVCKCSHVVLLHVLATCSSRFHRYHQAPIKTSLYICGMDSFFLCPVTVKVRSTSQISDDVLSPLALRSFNRSIIHYRRLSGVSAIHSYNCGISKSPLGCHHVNERVEVNKGIKWKICDGLLNLGTRIRDT